MTIELGGLGKKIVLEGCSELNYLSHRFGYLDSFRPNILGIFFYKQVKLRTPYTVTHSSDAAIMDVKINNIIKKITGPQRNLLAIFQLAMQYQHAGQIKCKYCNRVSPKKCPVVGFLNYLDELK